MKEHEIEKEARRVWLHLKDIDDWASMREIGKKIGMEKRIVRSRLERLLKQGKVEKRYHLDEMSRTVSLWKVVEDGSDKQRGTPED